MAVVDSDTSENSLLLLHAVKGGRDRRAARGMTSTLAHTFPPWNCLLMRLDLRSSFVNIETRAAKAAWIGRQRTVWDTRSPTLDTTLIVLSKELPLSRR